jgi:hypothetical protein
VGSALPTEGTIARKANARKTVYTNCLTLPADESKVAYHYPFCPGTTPLSSIVDHRTALYVFIDDFFLTRPALAPWRRSPHHTPLFADSEVLTMALLPGFLGVASLKQTYRLVAHNCRAAFPYLCSYQQWIARLQALAIPIGVLLETTAQVAIGSARLLFDRAKPWPVCHPVRHGRVRLLRQEGAYWGKTSKGWFFGFKLHGLRHIAGRIVNVALTPGNWDERAPLPYCWVSMAAARSAIWATGESNGRRSGPNRPRCSCSHERMPRR